MHSYGEKVSIFLKAYPKVLFEQINMEPKLSSTENSHDRSMTYASFICVQLFRAPLTLMYLFLQIFVGIYFPFLSSPDMEVTEMKKARQYIK
jgi:hypothetical protein